MRVALEGEENRPFPVPDGMEFRRVNRADGQSALDSPDGVIINEVFKPGQMPNPRTHEDGANIQVIEMGGVF